MSASTPSASSSRPGSASGAPAASADSLVGVTAIVTGSSRGFGRATAIALAGRGARVVGVARDQQALDELSERLGDRFVAEVADVTDPDLPGRLIDRYGPSVLVLNAGAAPPLGSLREQSWEQFSTNWNVDVAHSFHFIRAALAAPLPAGSVVVSLSSGAAVKGSPLSGGYAGAKSTVGIISSYAGAEAAHEGLGIRFVAVLPALTPATELGRPYTRAYADRAGLDEQQFLDGLGGELSTGSAAAGITELVVDHSRTAPAYLLTAVGLRPAGPDTA